MAFPKKLGEIDVVGSGGSWGSSFRLVLLKEMGPPPYVDYTAIIFTIKTGLVVSRYTVLQALRMDLKHPAPRISDRGTPRIWITKEEADTLLIWMDSTILGL